MHEGAWTLIEVQGTLDMLFEQQYTLTATVDTVTGYRTQRPQLADLDDGAAPPAGDDETVDDAPSDLFICNVKLENFNLSHLPIYIMGEESLSRYMLYTMTLGNRPDLFPVAFYPNASFPVEYGRHEIPPEYFGDEAFAAMITEAEKHLGLPYVWGGYSPTVGFDCSGFVSWVLNHSGWDIGRLGASGLYNISVPISASDAKPGDLVFFINTYAAPDPNAPTHVGIYVGDGMMIHAGHPVGYASIETSYWQQHFYAFGRIN